MSSGDSHDHLQVFFRALARKSEYWVSGTPLHFAAHVDAEKAVEVECSLYFCLQCSGFWTTARAQTLEMTVGIPLYIMQ